MTPQSQAHFGDYWPPDFGWAARDPEATPSLLAPFSYNGVSFGSMHRDVVGLFTAFLDELVPHIPGGLHAGSCGCYNPGSKLPDGSRSFHTWAIAVDINWNVNQMGQNIPDASGTYAVPRYWATLLAPKYGLEWGGNWVGGYHDNMHFECHLSPADARAVQPSREFTVNADDKVYLDQQFAALKTAADDFPSTIVSPVNGKPYPVAQYLGTLDSRTWQLKGAIEVLAEQLFPNNPAAVAAVHHALNTDANPTTPQ